MRNKLLLLLILLLLSTACKEASFQLDDIIQQCYVSKYQDEGFDINAIIDDYETILINDGVLKNKSGKSYLEVYKKIISDEEFRIQSVPFKDYDPWHKVDKMIVVAIFECEKEMIEMARQTDSKWLEVFNKFEAPEIKEHPEKLYLTMQKHLSTNDLNSYYFKLKMFYIFDMVNAKR